MFPAALDLSIDELLARLEEKVAHPCDKKAFHAAALETALAHLEAFKTASLSAGELLEKDEALAKLAAEVEPEILLRVKRSLSQRVAKVLEDKAPDAVFGATAVTQEIEHRWGASSAAVPIHGASPPPSAAGPPGASIGAGGAGVLRVALPEGVMDGGEGTLLRRARSDKHSPWPVGLPDNL